jgi:DNA adenine methylase
VSLKPFLKWAGGKRWLVDRDQFEVPDFCGRYFEPFLGGGAVFFALEPSDAFLADANGQLVEAYVVLRDHCDDLLDILKSHHTAHSKEYYYFQREQEYDDARQRAALFIYLNRACWNGLYRVNRLGKFNVPIGTKNWILSPSDNFYALSKALSNAEIVQLDFRETLAQAHEGDFIFVDPPYTTAHNFNGFVKYNQALFSWHDQEELQAALLDADSRGAKFMLTNADHSSLRNLYTTPWSYESVPRQSVISGAKKGRSKTSEILVRNYGR